MESRLLISRGYAKVVVGSDNLVAVNMIKESLDGIPLNTIAHKIKVLVNSFEAFELNRVRRDGNVIADYLAKTCETADTDIRTIDIPCTYVNKLLIDDLLAMNEA